MEKYDEALKDFERVIEIEPEDATAYLNKGTVFYYQQKYDEAEVLFNKSLKMDDKLDFAYNNLGLLSLQKKDYEKAMKYFNKAIDIRPSAPYYLNNRGYTNLMLNNFEEARKDIDKSLLYDGKNPWALRNIGIYFYKSGTDTGKGIAYLKKALELKPDLELIHFYLGEAYLAENNKEQACEEWNLSLEKNEVASIEEKAKACQ